MTYSGFTNPVYEEWKKGQQSPFSSFYNTPSSSKESRESYYYITGDLPPLKKRTEEEIAKDKEEQKTKLYNNLYDEYTEFITEGDLSSDDFFAAIMQVATDELERSGKEHAKAVALMSNLKKEQTVFS
jgi:hypothetical protein